MRHAHNPTPDPQAILRAWMPFKKAIGVTAVRTEAEYATARSVVDALIDVIGAAKGLPQGVQIRKDLPSHDPVPRLERTLGLRMLLPELDQGGLRHDVHRRQYTKVVSAVKALPPRSG